MSKVTLVVPAYNEQSNIRPFFERCREVEQSSSHVFDYVFIDDGSTDGTFDEIQKIVNEYSIDAAASAGAAAAPAPRIKGIRFSRNFGKEAGILAGLRESAAKGGASSATSTNGTSGASSATSASNANNYTVIIDADMQQDPEYLLKMADFLDSNPDYDCVACYQENRKEGFMLRFMKKRFYRMMDNTSDTEFVEDASDFRMLRSEMVDAVLELGEYHRFSKGIFSWVGFNTYYMPYTVEERQNGETKWTFGKLFRYAADGIIGFSTTPLRVSTWLGGITSLAALIFLIYNVLKTLIFGKDVPGYQTIVCLILIVGGVQMVLLGIMGEYISRIFIESKKRPIYIVKETTQSMTKSTVEEFAQQEEVKQ